MAFLWRNSGFFLKLGITPLARRVPEVDPTYEFDPDMTKAILASFSYNRRPITQGYHGTGKPRPARPAVSSRSPRPAAGRGKSRSNCGAEFAQDIAHKL
ncbi:Aerobic cobaltochelatase CobS subunit [Candidatus Rhodobacter oscarellae]|uniref:Aerobic cobaltochelatase CobS subunit n=1 Tax=Candidatus Rhodobacter oscarellae TaxID=1675527 RepID=A0A0J9E0E7_9RHOB|nr:Aerobic cobaltochelatase CobS subunit [Candidatus Rhodobacter lobularis]